jgi:ATP-binding cassette subfamily C protein LapB
VFSQSALQLSSAGIVCLGVILVGTQSVTSGALIACVILSGRILSPLVQIGQLMTRLNNTLLSYKNIDSLMKDISRDELAEDNKAVVLKNGNIVVKFFSKRR